MRYRYVVGTVHPIFYQLSHGGMALDNIVEREGKIMAFTLRHTNTRYIRADYAVPGLDVDQETADEAIGAWARTMERLFGERVSSLPGLVHKIATNVWGHKNPVVWRPPLSPTNTIGTREDRILKATHGPRSELLRWRAWGELTCWDIERCYLHIAQNNLPISEPYAISAQPKEANTCAVYEADVRIPSMEMAPLVGRFMERPIYPTGSWRGWFWDQELDRAREAGAEIAIRRGYAFYTAPILRPIMQKIKAAQEQHPEYGASLKLLANMLVGKCLAKNKRREWLVGEENEPDGAEWVQIGPHSPVWYRDKQGAAHLPTYAPAIFSWVTSQARCAMWDGVQGMNPVAMHVDGFLCASDKEPTSRIEGIKWKKKWQRGGDFKAQCASVWRISAWDGDDKTNGLWEGWDFGEEHKIEAERNFNGVRGGNLSDALKTIKQSAPLINVAPRIFGRVALDSESGQTRPMQTNEMLTSR